MPEEKLSAEKKDVTIVESVSIRAVGNGFIVSISGKDKNDEYAYDEEVFLDKNKAVKHMSSKIGS